MYLALRFLKLLGVAMLFSGVVGAVLARGYDDRRRLAHLVAAPGFGLTWLMGFTLIAHTSVSPLSLWILGGMVLSLFSLQVVVFAAAKPERRSPTIAALAIVPLAGTLALMVFKPA